MYKCKECGAEYEEQPDYCDCGNDEFDLVIAVAEENINPANTKNSINNKSEHVFENETEEQKKIQAAETVKFNKSEQFTYLSQRKLNIDPMSLTIFSVCIFLSLYVIFFAWNGISEENNQKDANIQTTVDTKNIPSIDKFWDNSLPVVKVEQKKSAEPISTDVVSKVVQQIIPTSQPVQQKKTNTQNKTSVQAKTTTKPKTATVTLQKTTKTTSNKQQTKTAVNTQAQAQKTAEDAAKQKAEAERKAAEAAQIKKLQAEQAKKAAEEKAKQAQASKQELATYKANLRNTVARKIDFTRVIGDGSCTVSFRIDSNGNLINRSFTKQSTNNTLNDAVYAAVMATPTFSSPPSAYNNEILNLNIKFYNGNFEISLP